MSAKLSLLTSADAVRGAIAECTAKGREAFLKEYGYRYSRLYPLIADGHRYDSKAIVGVAFGKQHGTPLRANEFSGGARTVVPVLKRLGFVVEEILHPMNYLVQGRTYSRKDLLERFGGQLQAGIWTPKEFPVVFLFSGDSGRAYGYEDDDESEEGVFRYTGEGQTGDMTFTGGNKAIRDHRRDGKDLLLFKDLGKGKGVRFEGLFECASWETADGRDKHGSPRKILIFDLVRVRTAAADDSEHVDLAGAFVVPVESLSIEELRKLAYKASDDQPAAPKTGATKRMWYERSAYVRNYVLARAKGVCEACDKSAPFIKRDGSPYLEPHHTTRLADDGPDHPGTVGAICPTCHRRIHSGEDGPDWNHRLIQRLRTKEPQFPGDDQNTRRSE